MSFTTVEQTSSDKFATVLLSPSKSKRKEIASPSPQNAGPPPSNADIWKWTLTSDATAPCFIRDVYAMTENTAKDADFFWLGSIPCRSVRLVGLIVGVQVYEKRIVYSVDDGTSVIDCIHRPTPLPTSPTKHSQLKLKPEPPLMPKPLGHVGSLILVVGKVVKWHDTRRITVDSIERCTSANDEPNHWNIVLALHKSSYSLPGPFKLPNVAPSIISNPYSSFADPSSSRFIMPTTSINITPCSTPPSSAPSSPTKPSSNLRKPQDSPPRLRHPSRLHSCDLTSNSFRIYVKHYMDNAPLTPYTGVGSTTGEAESDDISYSLSRVPLTPTKARRSTTRDYPERTPRASGSRTVQIADQTPRTSNRTLPDEEISLMRGFTLSHLRRVPELADMARRVVNAEAKRRAREERKKAKEDAAARGGSQKATPSTMMVPAKAKLANSVKIGPKMKRLFEWAIVKLYEEGSIVLWDGPVRRLVDRAEHGTSQLWKANMSSSTYGAGADSTVSSSVGVSQLGTDIEDVGELSDPAPEEEAYIPLTPAYLVGYVEKAIRVLMSRPPRSRGPLSSSLNRIQMAGPTKEEITAFLRRDGRWAKVGDWVVGDVLEAMKAEGRVWMVGGGRWEMCI